MSEPSVEQKRRDLAEQDAFLQRALNTGDATLITQANRLKTDYHARELAILSDDVYEAADGKAAATKAPTGYIRGSANPELLRAAGINWSDEQIADFLQPKDSGFRAEIYLRDPAVFGPNAKPILVFKGTDSDQNEDWLNNARQGSGLRSDYYDRAMEVGLAVKVAKGKDGFEISGHSLGGGLASAASAVTGTPAITFNSAGLHSQTVPRFMKGESFYDTNKTVTAYQVQGEVLTTVQTGLRDMNSFRRAQVGFMAETVAELSKVPGAQEKVTQLIQQHVIKPPGHASAEEKAAIQVRAGQLTRDAKELIDYLATHNGRDILRQVPTAAGQLMPTLAPKGRDAQGHLVDKPQAATLGDIGELAMPFANALTLTLGAARVGKNLGDHVATGGRAANTALDKVGDVQESALRLQGKASDAVITGGGQVAGGVVRFQGNRAADARQVLGAAEAGLERLEGRLQKGFFDIGSYVLRKVGQEELARDAKTAGQFVYTQNEYQARQAETRARDNANTIRSTTGAVADNIQSGGARLGDQARQSYEQVGKAANQTTDAAGRTIKNVTHFAPTAGATVFGGFAAGLQIAGAIRDPATAYKAYQGYQLYKQAPGAFAQATDRHLMTESVRPSLDFRIQQREQELSRHQLMKLPAEKTSAPPTPENPAHKDHAEHQKIRATVEGWGYQGDSARNMSAAILLEAKSSGVLRIDELKLNEASAKYPEGSLATATYRPFGDKSPFFHARVELSDAERRPAENSFQEIEKVNQKQTSLEQQHTRVV